MNIVELLKKIENKEIKEGAMFCGGDLFYDLVVIDKSLYIIQTTTKEIKLLESRYIGNFIEKNYELYEYKKVLD